MIEQKNVSAPVAEDLENQNLNLQKRNRKTVLPTFVIKPKPLSRYEVILERLESDSRFVGGIYGGLYGTLAGVILLLAAMITEPTRNFFLYFCRAIYLSLPSAFAPPNMLFPAHVIAPLLFVALLVGVVGGAYRGAPPPPRHQEEAPPSFREKTWFFVILLGVCVIAAIAHLIEHPPQESLLNFFNSPEFIIPATLVLVGGFVYSFSSARNDETNSFRLRVYLLLGVAAALIAAMIYTLQSVLLYAIR